MIRAYSQRVTPPYSGMVQIAETDDARALSMDGTTWEFHFLYTLPADTRTPGRQVQRKFTPVMTMGIDKIKRIGNEPDGDSQQLDDRIRLLVEYLATASLPFDPIDQYECWLLDPKEGTPLALVFSCIDSELIETFPNKPDWTALPAAVMPIEKTEDELERGESPVNYRVERMVAERAGYQPKVQWFQRNASNQDDFPSLLLTEDWPDEEQQDLCRRYLERQSSRLLMLHHLLHEERQRLEIAARRQVFEIERFSPCYPEIIDQKLINRILVEARLRGSSTEEASSVQNRRDGIHYM